MSPFQLSPQEEQKLRELLNVFLEENAKLNLSAYRTEEQCWVGNILDSIACLDTLRHVSTRHDTVKIIDVGTGGGFPLLPLAMLLPEIRFTGLDATQKKEDAVQRMVNHLALPNVTLLIGRAEELGHDPQHREQYDLALGRAVAELPTLLEFMSPFARAGGKMFCWKSLAIEGELQAALNARLALKCRLSERLPYDLDALAACHPAPHQALRAGAGHRIFGLAHHPAPRDSDSPRIHLWGTRQLLLFEKTEQLPKMFPRKTGTPKKEPL